MREIKFRVWDKEEKKFLEPCFESEEDKFNKGMAMIRWNSKGKIWFTLSGYRDEDGNPYQIDAELMQYTGLKDKNGKEIYEGDIIKGIIPEIANEPERIGIVKWGSYSWIIDFQLPKCAPGIGMVGFCSFHNYEIIGNIHENIDLLESEV